MHKLLVPIDSSESAMRALEYAIRLAREHGSIALHIVHAHDLPLVYGEIAVYVSLDKAKELQQQHSEDVLRPAIEKAEAAGVQCTREILTGHIPTAIAQCAKERGCDAIVMGTRGLGAIGNLVMGSVATQVIHLTTLPVTLVK